MQKLFAVILLTLYLLPLSSAYTQISETTISTSNNHRIFENRSYSLPEDNAIDLSHLLPNINRLENFELLAHTHKNSFSPVTQECTIGLKKIRCQDGTIHDDLILTPYYLIGEVGKDELVALAKRSTFELTTKFADDILSTVSFRFSNGVRLPKMHKPDTGPVSGLRCTFGYTIGGTLEDAKILTNLSDIHWPENTFFLPEKTYDPKNPKNISISHFIKKEDLYFDSAIVPKSMAHGIFLHIAYSNYPHTKEFSVIFAKELGELNFIKNHHDLEQLQFDKINVDNIGIEKLDFSQLQVDEKNRTFSGIENIGLEKLDYPKLDLSKVGLEKVGVNHDEAAQWLGKSIDFSKLISEENQNENY